MGITVLKDGSREYYRITKAWDGKEIQKYVRIGKDRKRAEREAKALQESLDQRYKAHLELKALRGEGVVHDDGRVVGLQIQSRSRAGRKDWQEFKIRIKLPDKPAKHKTVSVGAHGIEKAFDIAIERICDIRNIEVGSDPYKKMMMAKPLYMPNDLIGSSLLSDEPEELPSEIEKNLQIDLRDSPSPSGPRLSDDEKELYDSLMEERESFKESREVIKG
ncbi:hypothetical protein A9Q99_15870 [Gammaproteobacteria bacterium 45_16_T64]|nr:hypothetical protein A9Q99_15870 [Gammaproteobacteria bacterium 45_16_T64]